MKRTDVSAFGEAHAGASAYEVGIYSRVLAAGVWPDTGRLRLTLLLTPAPKDSASTIEATIPLSQWPTKVVDAFRKLDIGELDGKKTFKMKVAVEAFQPDGIYRPRPHLDGTSHEDPAFSVTAHARRLRFAFGETGESEGDAALLKVQRLWTNTFVRAVEENDGDPWKALHLALTASFAGSAHVPGKFAGQPGNVQPDNGQPPINDVRSIRQSDIAVGLELTRAHEVAASIREAFGDPNGREAMEAAVKEKTAPDSGPDPATTVEEKPPLTPEQARQLIRDAKAAERASYFNRLNRDPTTSPAASAFHDASASVDDGFARLPQLIRYSGSLCPTDLATQKPEDLHATTDGPLASHGDGTWLEQSSGQTPGAALAPTEDEATKRASQRFFALQSAPSLARLFGLVVDLEVEGDDEPAATESSETAKLVRLQGKPAGYFFLGTGMGRTGAGIDNVYPYTVTVAKLEQRGGKVAFWPVTRAEIDLPLDEDKSPYDRFEYLQQTNGVMVLGRGWAEGDPRFELTSLDVRNAAETQEQRNRERAMLPVVASDELQDPRQVEMRDRPIQRQTLMTAGFTLLDRGREAVTAAKLAVRSRQKNNIKSARYVLLDADELTVGFRPDIAVYAEGAYQWRGLMNREIVFGATGQESATVKDLLDCLTGRLGEEQRTMLDSAVVSTPMRLMPEAPTGDGKEGFATIVEEIVTSWDGGPMGVDCSGPDESKKVVEDLPIGRDLSLPTQEDARELRPPRLRFGWPYRIGMRAVYMGGASPSVEAASLAYESRSIAYPPGPGDGTRLEQRRFLRHERIDAPILLLPGDLASRGHGEMGFERSPEVVVRTYVSPIGAGGEVDDAENDAKRRATPQTSRRIFVAPRVAQAFAGLHGVFDNEDGKHPEPGLKGVRYDAERGGFPYAKPEERRGLDGILFPLSRSIADGKDDRGDAVFETTRHGAAEGGIPYYPDPTARHFVLALRHPGTKRYLEGRPHIVSLYEDGRRYPHAMPLEVVVEATEGKRRRGGQIRHEDVIRDGGIVRLDPTSSGKKVEARSVILTPYPGEDFELVIWCASDVTTLARVFAVVETMGALASLNAATPFLEDKDLRLILPPAMLMAGPLTDGVRYYLSGQRDADIGFAGIGGLRTPGVSGLKAIASVVHHAMCLRPVDELGATTVLRVTHAVNRPILVPQFAPKAWMDRPGLRGVQIARPNLENAAKLRITEPENRYGYFFEKPVVDAAASDFVLGGTVRIDLDTSDGFEIEAITTFPRTPKLDDNQKRRTRDDRRAGFWPTDLDLNDGKVKLSATSDIYGFHVAADGKVELPRSSVTLLRVEDIPSPQVEPGGPVWHDHEVVELEHFYGIEFATKGKYASGAAAEDTSATGPDIKPYLNGCKVALPHAFPDGKARRLSLSAISLSRFDHSWRKAARRDDDNTFRPGDPLLPSAEATRSAPIDVWLPATFRPAKPITRTPLPAFRWDPQPTIVRSGKTVHVLKRTPLTRIWLRREWFSSGEGEKLGIVLWPPNLFEPRSATVISKDKVYIPQYKGPQTGHADGGSRLAYLHDFTDADLGPGGGYVTRWGGDPIRGGDPQRSLFIPPTQFLDKEAGTAALVPNVAMPIGTTEPQNGRVGAADLDSTNKPDDAEDAADTLTVSLLTYEPRFDVGNEEWYVDVAIRPGDATDPFVRLGLVRYQEHAPPHLRVSQPVIEWTQLLPARDAQIEVEEGEDGSLVVTASVFGQSQKCTARDPLSSELDNATYDHPVMVFTLVFEGCDGDGRRTQEVLAQASTAPAPEQREAIVDETSRAWVAPADGETTWQAEFRPISAAERERLGRGTYLATFEEVEYRHPATYPNEPLRVPENDTDHSYVASGPRFFARIDLQVEGAFSDIEGA